MFFLNETFLTSGFSFFSLWVEVPLPQQVTHMHTHVNTWTHRHAHKSQKSHTQKHDGLKPRKQQKIWTHHAEFEPSAVDHGWPAEASGEEHDLKLRGQTPPDRPDLPLCVEMETLPNRFQPERREVWRRRLEVNSSLTDSDFHPLPVQVLKGVWSLSQRGGSLWTGHLGLESPGGQRSDSQSQSG